MFESLEPAPPDSILGLTEAFNRDPNPAKINLSVGVYKDPSGRTPVLESVRKVQMKIAETETTKSYKPIDGAPEYAAAVQALMLGEGHPLIQEGRIVTAHTPGGTGALRVAGDFIHKTKPDATVWLSDPTWANHAAIFKAAGLKTNTYPYFDAATNSLAFDAMLEALSKVPAGDVVLLHGCCHNPTGVDPTQEQWTRIAKLVSERNLLVLLDFAYQGFAVGLDEDAVGLRTLLESCEQLLVCSSFSKNFGLYNERVGALSAIASTGAIAASMLSHIKTCIRANYSNPPAHGAAIVTGILGDSALKKQWFDELTAMRDRINGMRQLLVDKLNQRGLTLPGGDNQFIARQAGMFSFSGLNAQQVKQLRDQHAIYIVGSGRINVAGITADNIDKLCDALGKVLA